jgi:hypothetical protein
MISGFVLPKPSCPGFWRLSSTSAFVFLAINSICSFEYLLSFS